MSTNVTEIFRELFEWILRDRDNAIEAMTDLDGTLARAGITESDLSDIDIPAIAAEVCATAGYPAPAVAPATTSVGGATTTAPVSTSRPAVSSPASTAPTPPPTPPQPTYEYAKEYVTYVTEVVYEGDTVVQQTIVDNSVDNSTSILNDNSTNVNVEDVEGDVDLNLDVENTNVANTGDGGVAAGGDVSNAVTGDRAVLVDNDVNDNDLIDADLGGGFGRGFPNGGTNGGGVGRGNQPDLQINTGDNVNQTGGDVSDTTQVAGDNSGTVTGDVSADNAAFGSNNAQGNQLEDSALATGGDATNQADDIRADRGSAVSTGEGDSESTTVVADNSAIAVDDSQVDAENSLNELDLDLGRTGGLPGGFRPGDDFGRIPEKAFNERESGESDELGDDE